MILISGYFGFKNIGDEAILRVLVEHLKPFGKLKILSYNPEETKQKYSAESTHRLNLNAIVKCDLFISGGGGILQDKTSFKSFLYYLGLIWFAKTLGKKVAVIGQGIGPIKRGISKRMLIKVLNTLDLITVRDQTSFDFLKKAGLKNPKILETADLAFLLKNKDFHVSKEKDKRIIFSLRPSLKSNKIKEIAECIDLLLKNINYEVCLIPFKDPDDVKVINELLVYIKNKSSVTILPFDDSPEKALAIIESAAIVVGMRLHSLIFATNRLVPSIGLSYDPKVDAFMEEIGGHCVPLEKIEAKDLYNSIDNTLKTAESIKEKLRTIRRKMVAKAMSNFGLLRAQILETRNK